MFIIIIVDQIGIRARAMWVFGVQGREAKPFFSTIILSFFFLLVFLPIKSVCQMSDSKSFSSFLIFSLCFIDIASMEISKDHKNPHRI